MQYLDFDLKIERAGSQYHARVLRSPAGEAVHEFALPLSAERRELLLLRMTRLRSASRRIESPEVAAARELGEELYKAVFGPDLRACLRASIDRAGRTPGTGLRIKLYLQSAPELGHLPWEFLRDPTLGRFLAQSVRTPIVRYLELPESVEPLEVALPLRLLVMISNPTDYQQLDVEEEKRALSKVLAHLLDSGRFQVEWLEEATLPVLQRRLRTRQYHIFHFIGHGGYDESSDEGVLVLENARERAHLVSAARLGTLLRDHQTLRLAFLNSCDGARNSLTDPFASVATTLIRDGLPAVIAMQFEISDASAITFADEFYSALSDGLPVDASVAEARKAISSEVEWGTPVLYMRASDGVLFRIEPSTVTEGPGTLRPTLDEEQHRTAVVAEARRKAAEEERQHQAQSERKAAEEEQRQAREAAEAQAREAEARRKTAEEKERQRQAESERKAAEEEQRQAREAEARRKTAEEKERQRRAESERKVAVDEQRKAREAAEAPRKAAEQEERQAESLTGGGEKEQRMARAEWLRMFEKEKERLAAIEIRHSRADELGPVNQSQVRPNKVGMPPIEPAVPGSFLRGAQNEDSPLANEKRIGLWILSALLFAVVLILLVKLSG